MNVKIFFLKNSTILMADYSETENNFLLRNPVQIVAKPHSEDETASSFAIAFAPFLHYTKEANEEGIPISKQEVLSMLEPIDQLESHYSTFFNKDE